MERCSLEQLFKEALQALGRMPVPSDGGPDRNLYTYTSTMDG